MSDPRAAGQFSEYWKKRREDKTFHINVVAHEDRDQAIDRCKEAILRSRGDILDFKMFSNLSLNMIIEISGKSIPGLLDALNAYGWNVNVEPIRQALEEADDQKVEGTLQMTFPKGDGEQRTIVPAVPG